MTALWGHESFAQMTLNKLFLNLKYTLVWDNHAQSRWAKKSSFKWNWINFPRPLPFDLKSLNGWHAFSMYVVLLGKLKWSWAGNLAKTAFCCHCIKHETWWSFLLVILKQKSQYLETSMSGMINMVPRLLGSGYFINTSTLWRLIHFQLSWALPHLLV